MAVPRFSVASAQWTQSPLFPISTDIGSGNRSLCLSSTVIECRRQSMPTDIEYTRCIADNQEVVVSLCLEQMETKVHCLSNVFGIG